MKFVTIGNHTFDINQVNNVTYCPAVERKCKTPEKEYVRREDATLSVFFKNSGSIIIGEKYIDEFKQSFKEHFLFNLEFQV